MGIKKQLRFFRGWIQKKSRRDLVLQRGTMSAAGFLSLLFLRTVFAIAVEFQLVVDHVKSAILLDLVLHIGKK